MESAPTAPLISSEPVKDGVVIHLSGAWTKTAGRALERQIDRFARTLEKPHYAVIDLARLTGLDTIGAWLIVALERKLASTGARIETVNAQPIHDQMLAKVSDHTKTPPAKPIKRTPLLLRPFEGVGRSVATFGSDTLAIMGVLGRMISAVLSVISFRNRLRFNAFVNQVERIGLGAIPIVALISLVVGAIITQQTILQLRTFGVAIYVVDLAAILMLREVGLLLAAIMVAGRSGSAITAEVGSMRMREELDALSVMGVDPYSALVVPRIIALVVALPLLAFVGSVSGLAGAAITALVYGDIPLSIFIDRLQDALSMRHLMVGMIKAPFMALIIGLVAINEGFKVKGSAESLGRRTTASVVQAIFLVIVADGLFAMFFAAIGF